jgi:hypothetical protein
MGRNHFLGNFQNRDRLFLLNAGEVVEKFVEGIASGEVVQEGFDGDAGADKYWCSAEDVWIAVDDGLEVYHRRE